MPEENLKFKRLSPHCDWNSNSCHFSELSTRSSYKLVLISKSRFFHSKEKLIVKFVFLFWQFSWISFQTFHSTANANLLHLFVELSWEVCCCGKFLCRRDKEIKFSRWFDTFPPSFNLTLFDFLVNFNSSKAKKFFLKLHC